MKPPAHSVEFTQVTEWDDSQARSAQDALAAEEPLEIRVAGQPITVTMRTPGHDVELAAGFLLTEGIVESGDEIAQIIIGNPLPGATNNVVEVELKDTAFQPGDLQRNFFAASSCGICGKASIQAIRRRGLRAAKSDFRIDAEVLYGIPQSIRAEQSVFERTGGLHAAALFNESGELQVLREDIGRHNAVDKVIGWALREHSIPLEASVLMVSGRGGFEIVQKAIAAGVPVIASVSAPSSLAVRLAREFRVTLIGFLRGRRFVVYSGDHRIFHKPAE